MQLFSIFLKYSECFLEAPNYIQFLNFYRTSAKFSQSLKECFCEFITHKVVQEKKENERVRFSDTEANSLLLEN